MEEKKYQIEVDPRILELLGPSLYTNIYYVLAELIANAYDADAENVYIISNQNDITVEDDGHGMSYYSGDIAKYLNVAGVSRTSEDETVTPVFHRRKMGRKGVGKLAALSVSENVRVLTVKNGEKSGFILTRHPKGKELSAIPENQIFFRNVRGDGTAIIMENPEYLLNKTMITIRKNLLKLFPLVGDHFRIHIIKDGKTDILEDVDKTFASQLVSLITMGPEFSYLADLVPNEYPDIREALVEVRDPYHTDLELVNNNNHKDVYVLEIRGWIGTYKTTKGRKLDITDFPDNFISLYAHKKMGEFNILPQVGQNKLTEVFVVGQLHVDLFEKSELPDMALSNRQGYKTDDPRYETVIRYVKNELLPDILNKRSMYAARAKNESKLRYHKELEKKEKAFSEAVVGFKSKATGEAVDRIKLIAPDAPAKVVEEIVTSAIESNISSLGIKPQLDGQKKKILISHTSLDKDLGEVILKMLLFNNAPPQDILFTSSDEQVFRIPEGEHVYDYLRKFFVDSYSDQKMYVIFVTSENTKINWNAIIEIGAAWITQIDNKVFNIHPFEPKKPLDNESLWHTSKREEATRTLYMEGNSSDIFCEKIEAICDSLGYSKRSRSENRSYLSELVVTR